MPDEFPTLEVVLAASVTVLVWRGWLLYRSRAEFRTGSERLLQVFRLGSPTARELAGAHLGPLLEPLARAALVSQVGDTPRAVSERASRIRRRIQSAAARDLVICAVLGGSLVYTVFADTVVGWTFYALGIAAGLLLLAAVGERIFLDRQLAKVAARFGSAVGAADASASGEISACRVCGEPRLERLSSPDDIGPRLRALGTREIFVCSRCGTITGKATHPARPSRL